MEQRSSFESILAGGSWITIGSFDGVHLGHQALVRRLVEGAHLDSQPAVVITFYPHPAVTLGRIQGPFYLSSPQEKAANLSALNVDYLLTLPFNREMAKWSAEFFMERLVESLHPRRFLTGQGFALGRNREGSIERLKELGEKMGYTLEVVQPLKFENAIVSSSQVRELLKNHQVEQAGRLLGRPYKVSGEVVPGDGRGRLIGVPTANIQIPLERLLPGNGVYATLTRLPGGETIPSISNIGVRPTFENEPTSPRLETHLMDIKRDLYGLVAEVEFIQFLRPEQRFASVKELISQIQHDISRAKEILRNVP